MPNAALEQGGKVATSVIEGMKSQPLALGLIVLNISFIMFVAWLAYTINERTESQYRVKDAQTATLLAKLDQIADVRAEVRGLGERIAGNSAIANSMSDAISRLVKTEEDHERRLRDLERQKP